MVEFALSFPILFLLASVSVQALRLGAAQAILECGASEEARALAAGAAGADLQARASAWAATLAPPATAAVTVRSLVALPTLSGRAPRSIEIIELDLTQPSPPFPFSPRGALHAHAREPRFAPVARP
ncbi:MAG: hypothetical protein JO102_02850 [Elusimicrobia bacterium]|nr:hypothetical protein [Elusimicrobiota bacterium]